MSDESRPLADMARMNRESSDASLLSIEPALLTRYSVTLSPPESKVFGSRLAAFIAIAAQHVVPKSLIEPAASWLFLR